MSAVEVSLLGALELRVDGRLVPLNGLKQRAIVAHLALQPGHVAPVASILDAVWGEPVPDRAEHTLQQHVFALRKLLDPDRSATSPALVTQSPGYRLDAVVGDLARFEDEAAAGSAAASEGRWDAAADACARALACWRGPAIADGRATPRLQAAAARLDEQRLQVQERRIDARLAQGGGADEVPELEHLVAEHPLRERLRGQLMLALYRSGRQADALSAYRSARTALVEELGIEPGSELQALEQAILVQSPALDRPTDRPDAHVFATFQAGAAELGRVRMPDGQIVVLTAGTSLMGRDPSALVRLVDNRVSRRHAQIDASVTRCSIRDLGSSNGTTVNGARIEQVELAHGDVIGLGGVEVTFFEPA